MWSGFNNFFSNSFHVPHFTKNRYFFFQKAETVSRMPLPCSFQRGLAICAWKRVSGGFVFRFAQVSNPAPVASASARFSSSANLMAFFLQKGRKLGLFRLRRCDLAQFHFNLCLGSSRTNKISSSNFQDGGKSARKTEVAFFFSFWQNFGASTEHCENERGRRRSETYFFAMDEAPETQQPALSNPLRAQGCQTSCEIISI